MAQTNQNGSFEMEVEPKKKDIDKKKIIILGTICVVLLILVFISIIVLVLLLTSNSNGTPTPIKYTWLQDPDQVPHQSVIILLGSGFRQASNDLIEYFYPNEPDLSFVSSKKMPQGRSNAIGAYLNGKIVIAGGLVCEDSAFGCIEKKRTKSTMIFDPKTEKWTNSGNMNILRPQGCGTAIDDTTMIACGGLTNQGYSSLNSCEIFNIETGKWTNITSMNASRSAAVSVNFHGEIYIISGYESPNELVSAESYNPKTGQWTALASMSVGKKGPAAATFNQTIVVCGGSADSSIGSSCEQYWPAHDTWTQFPSLLIPRCNFVMLNYNGRLLALGGYTWRGKVVQSVEEYDLGKNGWKVLDEYLAVERQNFVAVVSDL